MENRAEDQFPDSCLKENVFLVTPCFDALSYLCERLLELFELSWPILFVFYLCAIKGSFNTYLIYFTHIKSVAINKYLSQQSKLNGTSIIYFTHHVFYRLKYKTILKKKNKLNYRIY